MPECGVNYCISFVLKEGTFHSELSVDLSLLVTTHILSYPHIPVLWYIGAERGGAIQDILI